MEECWFWVDEKKFDCWVGCLLATQDVCISYIPYLPISTNSEHYPIILNSRVLSFREWYTYFHFPSLLLYIFFPLFSPQTNPLDFILWWFSCITTGTSTIVMESYHDTTNTGVSFFFFLGSFFSSRPDLYTLMLSWYTHRRKLGGDTTGICHI